MLTKIKIPEMQGANLPAATGGEQIEGKNGAPEEIRTPNLLIRSQVLYPVELRLHSPGYPFGTDSPIRKGG